MTETVSLRDYVDTRIDAVERAAARELIVIDSRLDKMNALHNQFNVQYAGFTLQLEKYLPRDEYSARHEALIENIRIIENWRYNLSGRLWAIGFAVGAFIAVIQVILTIATKMVSPA